MNATVGSGQRSQSENLNDALDTLETFVHQARGAVSHPLVDLEGAIQLATRDMMTQISAQLTTLTESITTQIGALSQKVGQLDQKVGQLDQKVNQLDQKVDQLDQKVDRNHSDVTDKIDNLGRKLSYL